MPKAPHDPTPQPPTAEDDRPAARVLGVVSGRWFVKLAFLAYFVFACLQLMRFAAWARGEGPYVPRPEAPGGLLPVGHFMSFFAFLRGGGWDALLPAGPVIIIAALSVSLLFRRGFCGWICPVGTVWELFSAAGRRVMGRNLRPPRWLDIAGRVVRYALTAAIAGVLLTVPLAEAVEFRLLPYMWTADIKIITLMLTSTFLLVAAVAAVLSALFGPVWCRYLCPVGGLYSAVAALSPGAIQRDEKACVGCGSCSAACPAFIDVEHARVVRDTECDGCMECARACPEQCVGPQLAGRVRVKPQVWPLLVVGLWLAIFALAYVTGNWNSPIPAEKFRAAIAAGVLEQRSGPSQ